jgi:predicted phosphodiesterase
MTKTIKKRKSYLVIITITLSLTLQNCNRFFSFFITKNLPPICHSEVNQENKVILFVSENPDENCFEIYINEQKRDKRCETKILLGDIQEIKSDLNYSIYHKEENICSGKIKPIAEKIKFAVIGDTSYKTGYLKNMIEKIAEFQPDFTFHVGDFQYDTQLDRWDEILKIFKPIFQNSFFFLSAGNHEYESETDEQIFKKYFPEEGFFAFRNKDIWFVGINMFSEKLDEFLENISQKINYPTIFFIHKPFVSLARGENLELSYKSIFSKIKDKAFLIFSGHDHLYGRVKIGNILQVITGGGGARIYPCSKKNISEKVFIDDSEIEIKVEKCVEEFNFILCEIENQKVFCKAESPTSGKIDEFSSEITH